MAKFNSAALLRKRQFQRLTALKPPLTPEMVERLRPRWQKRVVDTKNGSGRPWGIGSLEDHLLVLLILYRCAITQDFLGLLYGDEQSGDQPRSASDRADCGAGFERQTRNPRERRRSRSLDRRCHGATHPAPDRKQRCWYSGKKKRHTIKTEAIITEQGKIVSVCARSGARARSGNPTTRAAFAERLAPPMPTAAIRASSKNTLIQKSLQENKEAQADKGRTRLQSCAQSFPRPRRARLR